MSGITKYKASNLALHVRPYSLNFGIWSILKDTSNFFFQTTSKNVSILNYYVFPLLTFYKTKDLNTLCWFTCSASQLENPYPISKNILAVRVLATSLFQKFTYHCWNHVYPFTSESPCKHRAKYQRMMECSPVGFQVTKKRSCEHSLCLNCHLRRAIRYRKRLTESQTEHTSAIVIKVETPFLENLMTGSYSPVFPLVANTKREYPLMDMVKKVLNPKGKAAIGKCVGVTVDNRHPSTCTCIHVLCGKDELDYKYEKALKFALKLTKQQKDYSTKTTVLKCLPNSKTNKLDVDNLTYMMYNNAPIRLLATSITGFTSSSQDICLETTVKNFYEQNKNRKLNIIKDM